MEEPMKRCLHCGSPMQANRDTRKYCSDSCRQAAYRQTKWNSTKEQSLACTISSYPICTVDVGSYVVTATGNGDTCSPYYRSITSRQADAEPDVGRYIDQSAGIAASSGTGEDRMPPVLQPTDIPDESEPEDKVIFRNGEIKAHAYGSDYIPVRSPLIEAVWESARRHYETQDMMCCPQLYWHPKQLETVRWVSIRFRCVLESYLFHSRRITDLHTIVSLGNAIDATIRSGCFIRLPGNYPFTRQMLALQQALNKLAHREQQLRYYLSMTERAELIRIRNQLAAFVPKAKSEELDFSP